ncbi:hypothetical protein TWF751_004867 [Orbilia oligospora]|nr:hypothetical protein TWF751_004867 [Orbilia oligospora]KAF3242958.1 hypothetical protein TWF128_010405 [Orbilia oligospora]
MFGRWIGGHDPLQHNDSALGLEIFRSTIAKKARSRSYESVCIINTLPPDKPEVILPSERRSEQNARDRSPFNFQYRGDLAQLANRRSTVCD